MEKSVLDKIHPPTGGNSALNSAATAAVHEIESQLKDISKVFGETLIDGLAEFLETMQSENEKNRNAPFLKDFMRLSANIKSIFNLNLREEVLRSSIMKLMTSFCQKESIFGTEKGILNMVYDDISAIGTKDIRKQTLHCLTAIREACQLHYEAQQEMEKATQLEKQKMEACSMLNWTNKINGVFNEVETVNLDRNNPDEAQVLLAMKEEKLRALFLDFYKVCKATGEDLDALGFIDDMPEALGDVDPNYQPEPGEVTADEPWEPDEEWLVNEAWEAFKDHYSVMDDDGEEDPEATLEKIQKELLRMNAARENTEQMDLWDTVVNVEDNRTILAYVAYGLLAAGTAATLWAQRDRLVEFGEGVRHECDRGAKFVMNEGAAKAKQGVLWLGASVVAGLASAANERVFAVIKAKAAYVKDAIRSMWKGREEETKTMAKEVDENKGVTPGR